MTNYHVEPEIFFDLLDHMCIFTCSDTLYRGFRLGEWPEKVDDSLRDLRLLALLVDISRLRIEIEQLDICVLLIFGFLSLGNKGGVHQKARANLDLIDHGCYLLLVHF